MPTFVPHALSPTTVDYRTGLSWRGATEALIHDAAFRTALTECLAAHTAIFWECVPTSRECADDPFRFVAVESPQVARLRPDREAFAHLLTPPVATFANLPRDAMLIVPYGAVPAHSAHIAEWCRHPTSEHHALWAQVGTAVQDWWARTPDPVWVSTSGLGVPWLHVRLDRRPKYISHRPFRAFPAAAK